MSGERIDRYGNEHGSYFSPEGTLLENRSSHPFTNTDSYNSFEITKPLTVRTSIVAPFYGQPGGGIQYITPYKTSVLLEQGYIKP